MNSAQRREERRAGGGGRQERRLATVRSLRFEALEQRDAHSQLGARVEMVEDFATLGLALVTCSLLTLVVAFVVLPW